MVRRSRRGRIFRSTTTDQIGGGAHYTASSTAAPLSLANFCAKIRSLSDRVASCCRASPRESRDAIPGTGAPIGLLTRGPQKSNNARAHLAQVAVADVRNITFERRARKERDRRTHPAEPVTRPHRSPVIARGRLRSGVVCVDGNDVQRVGSGDCCCRRSGVSAGDPVQRRTGR